MIMIEMRLISHFMFREHCTPTVWVQEEGTEVDQRKSCYTLVLTLTLVLGNVPRIVTLEHFRWGLDSGPFGGGRWEQFPQLTCGYCLGSSLGGAVSAPLVKLLAPLLSSLGSV